MLSSTWQGFLNEIEKNNPAATVYLSVLKQIRLVEVNSDRFTIDCRNQGMLFYLAKKKGEIEAAFSRFVKKDMRADLMVRVSTKKTKKDGGEPLLSFKPSIDDVFARAGLNKKYQLENFAVSSTNQVAFAAAQAVVDNPGGAYNPLFLHGGVGVGKTHLAQAVARKILETRADKHVLFCPGDNFTNELIEAIRGKTTPRFRRKYRGLDLLIIDDVQFIAGKMGIQEEFFHTFNSVISAGGQIILTSDRPPEEIKNLEDRLRSRFRGGMIVDIQSPDFELRSAILLIKATEKNIPVTMDAVKEIAQRVEDTRALEGSLVSIYARTIGNKDQVDNEAVSSFFRQKTEAGLKKVSPVDVIRLVCSVYHVRPSQIKDSTREGHVALSRQIIMYVLRQTMRLRLEEIAFILKRKDHTTVIHGVKKINALVVSNPIIKQEVDRIIQSLHLSP
ncbi:chromosomal replication initiator protein DnaA [Patescibacteria group bacterium]|nr:chromosomal replication initiator protein DnaA [Patescibacteria group bacterium]